MRHIRLLIFDLDYLVFDCALLKVRALRQSLASLADDLPQSLSLPDAADVEEAYRNHGFRWIQYLEDELGEKKYSLLQRTYPLNENRLLESGLGGLYPGIESFIAGCCEAGISAALGADAGRDYLMTVSDRHRLDTLFDIALSTEEFGLGGAAEMLDAIMRQAEVNPSETLVLGTRPAFFQAAEDLDAQFIGCAWGMHRHETLSEARFAAATPAQLELAVQEADSQAYRNWA